MPAPSPIATAPAYHRHRPEQTTLYAIVAKHYPRFVQEIERAGGHLPRFVRQEFEDYLKCGLLEHGFLRVKCDGCLREHLVAFSCKRRGFCPSCGARRMVESAAHLVDHVFPEMPVRQWVLTFPFPLRFLLAVQPEALTQVLTVVQRGTSAFVIHHSGLTVSSGARTGAVTLIQRRRWKAGGFPARERSALEMPSRVLRLGSEPESPPRQLLLRCSTSCMAQASLSTGSRSHLLPAVVHMLFLDGTYVFRGQRPTFHRARRPSGDELNHLLDRLSRRILRVLVRRGLLIANPEYPSLEWVPDASLDHLQAAAVSYRIAIGPHAGRKALTLYSVPPLDEAPNHPLLARLAGFSLHAATVCEAHQRNRLERLCRYITRPPTR